MKLLAHMGRSALTVLLLGTFPHAALAQIPGLDKPNTAQSQQEQAPDPLERSTPRGCIVAFTRAVDRGDFVSAARYMENVAGTDRNTERLARDAKSLIDRFYSQPVTSLSNEPTGVLDDGLAMDRERVGPLIIGDRKAEIILVRVTDPQAGLIWLISSETLDQIPALFGSLRQSWVERVMPASLVNRELFGISLAHWIVLAASLVVPFLLMTLLSSLFIFIARRVVKDDAYRRELDAWHAAIRWPIVITLALTTQLLSMRFLGFPLTFRFVYARIGLVVAVIAASWLLRELLTLGFSRARRLVWGKDRTSTQSLLLMGERLLKAFFLVVAFVAILIILGVDTGKALAALGIIGVALALGAQKTVENLLGGVFLLTDKAIAVGDWCNISNRSGRIEDITLRSVRLRTAEQTLVSLPAGVLAQDGIENFSSRQKILVQSTLRLSHGTSVEQLRNILTAVRALLDESPKIERDTARFRLVNFGPEAIEAELFAYVLTADVAEFQAVREELLLAIAAIVEANGSAFAMPTQFIYAAEKQDPEASNRTPGGVARLSATGH